MVASLLVLMASQVKSDYPIKPVPFPQVRLESGLLAERQQVNRSKTLRHLLDQNEKTGRMDNFRAAAGVPGAKYSGYFFNDSDVYKAIEAVGYSLQIHHDKDLEQMTDTVIDTIAKAQEPDGFLFTSTTCANRGMETPGPKEHWHEDGGEHQTYCAGHLYEAAVAYFHATGKRKLLDVALKNADLLCKDFGPNGKARHASGHEEVELGLVRLFRETGKRQYLDTAKLFLERRGRLEGRKFLFGDYSQDHRPIRDQDEAVGHAVRAAYLYMAMADVAALTNDQGYIRALDKLWDSAVGKKSYITGAIGATGAGEAFGAEYELPNLTAYAETCSSIAFMLWNHRMFLTHGDSKYMDMFEQTLYNAFMSGYAEDGCHFFYPNPLQSRGAQRPEWFGCACCPPNVARFIALLGEFAYATKGTTIYANMFMDGSAKMRVNGQEVTLVSKTNYPWSGEVTWTVKTSKPVKMSLMIRRPGWSRGIAHPMNLYRFADSDIPKITLSSTGSKTRSEVEGYEKLEGTWKDGDQVNLNLNMRPQVVLAQPNVIADRDRMAVQLGPVIFCAEFADQPSKQVLNLIANSAGTFSAKQSNGLYGSIATISTQMATAVRDANGIPIPSSEVRQVTLTPYFTWANRGSGEMSVWLPTTAAGAWPAPAQTLAYRAKVTTSFNQGSASALVDQLIPQSSIDHGVPYFHVWPHKGTTEWVEFAWETPQKVSEVEVYWFQDEGIGECRLPASWRVLAWSGGEWKPVTIREGSFGVEKDKFNKVSLVPVTASKIRLEIVQQKNWASGIHEAILR